MSTVELESVRNITTPLPGPRSIEIARMREQHVAGSVASTVSVYIERSEGAILTDVDGNRFIDFASGIAVTSLGGLAMEVNDAIKQQIDQLTHTCFVLSPYERYVEACARLNQVTPGMHEKRTALFNSGAEAVENAVKFARAATERTAVVVLDHAFHGRTNLAMAMTSRVHPYKTAFGPFAPEIYRIPCSYPYRDGKSGEQAARDAIDIISRQIGAETVAAIIAEPILGEGGFIVPAPGYLSALADWCQQNGALFIADEIQTGFCRTGDFFAVEHEGIIPDVVITAKGIANGMPLSAVTGRAEVMERAAKGGIGGTYSGNPVACAAAIATIDVMEREQLHLRARQIGELMNRELSVLQQRHPKIGDVRGRGAMMAIELVQDDSLTPDAVMTNSVRAACEARGLICLTAGTYGNVLRFLPPFTITDEQLTDGLSVLHEVFDLVDNTGSGA